MTEEGILELPGIGPKLLKRLERQLGGPDGVLEALERGDVVALSSVTGVSRQRAVEIVQAHRGEALDWLRTGNAEDLARGSLAPFLERAVTRMGRAKLETLAPTTDRDRLEDRLSEARAWFDRLDDVDLDPVVQALREVQHPTTPRPKPERDVTIYLEEGHLMDQVREEGLDRWVDIANDDMPSADQQTLVLAATMGEVPRGAVHVPPGEPWEIVPWADVAWAETNRDLLEALASLADHLETEDHATPLLEALAKEGPREEVDLADLAEDCVTEANQTIEQALEETTLSGKDVLQVLQGGSSTAVETVVSEARAEARQRFEAASGMTGAPFSHEYPLEIHPGKVRELERQIRADQAMDRFRSSVEVAKAVRAHRQGVQAMVSAAIELDRWQAAVRAARDLGLSLPSLGGDLSVTGALHLELEGQGDPVDYPVPNDVVLLTGANSGGKTTLLETLGQVASLTHLGLPVPAAQATVPVLDGLAYYARPRQLGAGAFEGFLKTIEDVLLSDDHILVLADELEAMTELEAASAIIAEVVDHLKARGCPTVLVTHLAPFILEHIEARVDGIEAKGLDEDNELAVDRTPKVGHLARSTPELILQRLRNQATGDRRAVYEGMLERLEKG